MNRLISTMLDRVSPGALPPIERDGRARILFLSIHGLGWKTFAEQLEDYAAQRDDVDATHIRLIAPKWMRLLNRAPGWPMGTSLAHPTLTWSWAVNRLLSRHLPVDRFDVIHCSPATAGLALARRRPNASYKFSVSTDCTESLWATQLPHDVPIRRWEREQNWEREIYGAADLIAPWCRWVISSLKNDYDTADEKIQLCRPALRAADMNLARLAVTPIRKPGPVRILFVGLDWIRKGGPDLLRWHQARFADRAELHIVCGKAPIAPEARNVIWHGAVPHEKLLTELFPRMDLFVFPTKVDILPAAVIEAVSFGLPTVSTRLAGIPELIQHDQTGFLCDAGDEAAFISAIMRLIDDADLRARMSQTAREFAAKEFTASSQFGPLFDRLVKLAETKKPAGQSAG